MYREKDREHIKNALTWIIKCNNEKIKLFDKFWVNNSRYFRLFQVEEKPCQRNFIISFFDSQNNYNTPVEEKFFNDNS